MAPICTSPHVPSGAGPALLTSKAPSRDRASVENSHRLLSVLSVGFSTHSTKNRVQPLRKSGAHNRGGQKAPPSRCCTGPETVTTQFRWSPDRDSLCAE